MLLKLTTNKRCILFSTNDIKMQHRGGRGVNLVNKLNFSKGEYIIKVEYND